MGALISLFISLLMMIVSLTMSLLMTMFNLLISLLASGFGGRRRSDSTAARVIVVLVIVTVVGSAIGERPGWLVAWVVVGLVLWLLFRDTEPGTQTAGTQTAQELAQRFGQIRLMSGGQFEVFVADLMRAIGYRATVLGGSGDQGVDIIATTDGERLAIQCKNYNKAVGNRPVQEVYAGAKHHHCQQAWVVAPAGFTKGALQLSGSVGVRLFDANSIRKWIKQADDVAKQREEKTATADGKAHDDGFKPLEL